MLGPGDPLEEGSLISKAPFPSWGCALGRSEQAPGTVESMSQYPEGSRQAAAQRGYAQSTGVSSCNLFRPASKTFCHSQSLLPSIPPQKISAVENQWQINWRARYRCIWSLCNFSFKRRWNQASEKLSNLLKVTPLDQRQGWERLQKSLSVQGSVARCPSWLYIWGVSGEHTEFVH